MVALALGVLVTFDSCGRGEGLRSSRASKAETSGEFYVHPTRPRTPHPFVLVAHPHPISLSLLERPGAYQAQIDRLRRKYGATRRLDALHHHGLSLGDLGSQGDELSARLSRVVAAGEYVLGPVTARPALIAGKWRTLCRSNLPDTIVLGVLAEWLGAVVEDSLSSRLYSYRIGRSSWEVIGDLRRYFAEHRRARKELRDRGLYVLHRDVRSYGESIRTDDESVLWVELDEALERARVPASHFVRKLVQGAMRPEVATEDGAVAPRIGVPTGSPVQTVACNLYLGRIDRLLENVPGAFYARFGDDMLFCHPDSAIAQRASADIDREVSALGLEIKPEKRADYYLTGPGRPSAEWPGSRPASLFDYLGFRLDLAGNVGLKVEKGRRFLRELRVRAVCAAETLDSAPWSAKRRDEDRARAVCGALARALDPASKLADPAAGVLRYVVTDRAQLRHFDHAIALAAAEALTGLRGPRAFREAPYRWLRTCGGLPSLVHARNGSAGSREDGTP